MPAGYLLDPILLVQWVGLLQVLLLQERVTIIWEGPILERFQAQVEEVFQGQPPVCPVAILRLPEEEEAPQGKLAC
jgi:hypothetical protein